MAGEGPMWARKRLQQELAEAYRQIGNVQGGGNENLGDPKGALASFQRAEQIARALVAAQPSFAARKLLVESLRNVGRVYYQTNDPARAEAYRKQTLAMARDLRKQYPGNEGRGNPDGQLAIRHGHPHQGLAIPTVPA
jgi:tetratricopeptide (TPR) repeat protein